VNDTFTQNDKTSGTNEHCETSVFKLQAVTTEHYIYS